MIRFALLLIVVFVPSSVFCGNNERGIPILAYHRFGPTVADSMTVTDAVFEAHLKYLKENGYRIVPLREVLELSSKPLPADARMVALTADDGHITVLTHAFSLQKKYRAPMTLFIYPSAISNASYAMSWDQLRELKASGLFEIESHTYWHPNFKKEQARLKREEYEKTVETQLKKSKDVLEKKMSQKINMLAWPFGIYDPWLEAKAADAGYVAAFSIDRHPAAAGDRRMAIPRYLMSNADQGKNFERIAAGLITSKN